MKSICISFFLFASLFVSGLQAQPFTFKTDTVTGAPGSVVYVRLRARQFNNITAMQGCVKWDTSIAHLDTISAYLLPQLSAANFNLSNRANGWYNFAWTDNFGVGVNFTHDSTMWVMKFTINNYSPACSYTAVRVIDGNSILGQTPLEVADNTFNPIAYDTLQGRINVTCNATITTGMITGSPFCAGASVNVPYTISGSFNGGNVFTVQLSNGSGSFAAPTSIGTLLSTTAGTIFCTIPPATPAGTGYRIRVIASNPAVTGSDNGANLTIQAASSGGTLSANPDSVCPGQPVRLSLAGYTGTNFTWQSSSDGTNYTTLSGNADTLVVNPPQSPTWYKVNVANGSCSPSSSSAVSVILHPQPQAAFTFVQSPPLSVTFTDGSTGAISWAWSFGDGQVSSQQNPVHTYSSAGTYQVQLIVTNSQGCSDTATQSINISGNDVQDNTHPQELALFPNPVTESFQIEYPADFQTGILTLTDLSGKILFKKELSGKSAASEKIQLPESVKGMLILHLSDGMSQWMAKLLVQ